MLPTQYQFFVYDSEDAAGPFELIGEGSAASFGDGDLTAFTPLELHGSCTAVAHGAAAFDPASFPPRELPDCPGDPVRRLDIKPVRSTPPDGGPIWYERAVERIERREVALNLAVLPPADREQVAALWNDGEGLTLPFEFTLPEPGATAELYVFKDPELQLNRLSAANSTVRVELLRVNRVGWTP